MNSIFFLPLLCVLCAFIGSLNAFASPAYVNLGSCLPFAVVAGATITNGGPSIITGDLALSPGSAVTGLPPGQVVGTQHITDGIAAACMGDLATAIIDANGRAADASLNGELGGMTLAPGVYKSDGGFAITGTLFLDGQNDPNAAWIFIMATSLVVNTGAQVVMLNYDNTHGTKVWWSAGSRADIFVNAAIQGTVMAYQSIAAQNGATTGPLMANIGEVTLLSNVVHSYNDFNAAIPSSQPSTQPSGMPSAQPSAQPSSEPTSQPSGRPSTRPSPVPTPSPSATPTASPTANPTVLPTAGPSRSPSATPTASPSVVPTASPTFGPTTLPTASPTVLPTAGPSVDPTTLPTASPTFAPTPSPSRSPSAVPTASPSVLPTPSPSASPTIIPTASPSFAPTPSPSASPTTASPSTQPSSRPSGMPSVRPTATPTVRQSLRASSVPTTESSGAPASAAPLSDGAIAGITVGGAVVVSAAVGAAYFFAPVAAAVII